MILEILDLLLQFLGLEFFKAFVDRISIYITQIVGRVFNCENTNSNEVFPTLDIIHQSENFIIVDKKADLLINSNDPKKITVQSVLEKQIPRFVTSKLKHKFYFAHRLDFSTSGVLCLPLNKLACKKFCEVIGKRKCRKYYIALLNGHLDNKFYGINIPIGEDVRYLETSKKMCSQNNKFCVNSKIALSFLQPLSLGYYEGFPATKVVLMPVTGRRHQLRIHCAEMLHNILGDWTYGNQHDKVMKRMFLHAIRLVVPTDIENLDCKTNDIIDDDINWTEIKQYLKLSQSYDLLYTYYSNNINM